MKRGSVIAIDGPAGAGKTTIARRVASALGIPHVDTGAMYRAVTLKALRLDISVDNVEGLLLALTDTSIKVMGGQLFLDGEQVDEELRSPEVTAQVSPFAAVPQLRTWMVALQREVIDEQGGVVEGRDIGTVVFEDAALKVFLTASPQERARRRALEDETTTLASLAERDHLDSNRAVSPMRASDDALVIDTTGRDIDAIVDEIVELVRAHAS
ncbi:MAG: (d)CMP kinase [Actinomycetota bacterium]